MTAHDQQEPPAAAFAALIRVAKPGQVICFRPASPLDTPEHCGTLQEVHQEGLLLETASGTEWIPAQHIHSWRLPKQTAQPEAQKSASSSQPHAAFAQDYSSEQAVVPPDPKYPVTQPTLTPSSSAPTPADLEILFAGDPVMLLPTPSFDLPTLPKQIQPDIIRWKNKYDYAQKVHEPARLSQDVAMMEELAETLQEPSLYYLAGLIADYSGLGVTQSSIQFSRALLLAPAHQEATTALATLAIREKDWKNAAKFLLWAVQLEGPTDKLTLMRCLGQCILRDSSLAVPQIGKLLTIALPDQARRLAISLVALTVRTDSDAYRAALACDVDELHKTTFGNALFSRQDATMPPLPTATLRKTASQDPSSQGATRRGRVSVYYPGRNFGFIVEHSTGQTWFFHKNTVQSESLLQGLAAGIVRQDVAFTGIVDSRSDRYTATDVSIISEIAATQSEYQKRKSLRLRLQAIPRDGSDFAKAMHAEQLDQLEIAEALYHKEILNSGGHAKSAIKNLAALKNRQGNPEDAIKILDTYKDIFSITERHSLDQMRVQFYVKARCFLEAATLLTRLGKNTNDRSKRAAYERQAAYCYLATGDFDKSIEKLEALTRTHPEDYASIHLLERAKNAKKTGLIPSVASPNTGDEEYEDILSSLALGLSSIAQHHLHNCEQRGIDARTRESGTYTQEDVRQVHNLLDKVRGRRPRERADYLLTLSWLCEHASNVTENQTRQEYLRRYFLALAEATMSDGSPKDVVRCYALESLLLCPIKGNDKRNYLEAAWVLLLGTYLPNNVEPSILLKPVPGKRLPQVIELLDEQAASWQTFLSQAGFYMRRAPEAFTHLEGVLKSHSGTNLLLSRDDKDNDHVKKLEGAFASLPSEGLSADRLRQTSESLAEVIDSLPFESDRVRIASFNKILNDAAQYALERHFGERETRYLRLDGDIERLIEDLYRFPTHLAFEKMIPALATLRDKLKVDFGRSEGKQPLLELRNVLDNDFYVLNDGFVALRLLVASTDESAPPIESIGLFLDQGTGEPCHSPEPLHGGQTREIELTVKPSSKQVNDGAFTVSIQAEYRTRKGTVERSQLFSLPVRLGEQSQDEIPNPYSRYAGGSPVEERSMFFGRADLVDRVVRLLSSDRTMGQCFVLYGQKRSGKSSVLKQVEERLDESVLYASLSAGTFTPGTLWSSFARLLLQELRFSLEDKGLSAPDAWPDRSDVVSAPLESIRDVSRSLKACGHHIVVAVDEFTYVFENSQEDLEMFMRGWKALLEAGTFNALLIGQDTMPRFKRAFPNEFGMTHDERLSYLSEVEASAMATEPILLEGLSRYRGQALQRLFDLTAGSPYFLQIACDRLVRHLNARRAVFVTEADIDQVARTLTVGSDALPPERFDGLVTAAGERVAAIPRDDLWAVLARIARESLHSGWCFKTALTELPNIQEAVKDLVDREILSVESDRVRIRVSLFSAWLRANQ